MRRPSILLVGLLCASVLCAEARAQSRNPFLDAALRLYDALEFEAALGQLDKAAAFAENSPADEATIALYRGIVRLELGDPTGAKTDFMTALAFDPETKLPRGVSPRIRDFFSKTRRELLASNSTKSALANPRPASVLPKKAAPVAVAPRPEPVPAAAPPVRPATETVPREALVPSEPEPVPATPPGNGLRVLSYALFGVGAALGGGGGYLGWQSSQAVGDARSATTQLDAGAHLDSARSRALGANVLYGAAAASVVGGLVALLTAD